MWLGHVSALDGKALLSHLAVYEQIALGACEESWHISLLCCRAEMVVVGNSTQ